MNLYSFMPPTINQSERDYSVHHGVYVRCFNQSERGYGVRHGVYVTGCTYAFRPISARHSRILISAAPCGGLRNLAQPHATSRSLTQHRAASRNLAQPQKKGSKTSYYTTVHFKSLHPEERLRKPLLKQSQIFKFII